MSKRWCKCRGCFRYTALGQGLNHRFGVPSYSYPPRYVEIPTCSARKESFPNGCDDYEPRWKWNLEQFLHWRLKFNLDRAVCFLIRVPIGKLRKPMVIDWQKIPYPECPRCKEIPYRVDYCVFCGQRFITKEDKR